MGIREFLTAPFRGPSIADRSSSFVVPSDSSGYGVDRLIETYALAATSVVAPQMGKPTWGERDPNEYPRTYGQIPLIYRSVNLIAHAAGTAPLRVYSDTAGDDEVKNHPLTALMRRPNPTMGESTFMGAMAMRASIAGFAVAEKERDQLGRVIGLWPLVSAWLAPIHRSDGTADWLYKVPGQLTGKLIKAEDVVPFRWAERPDGDARGLGPLEVCLREAGIMNAMTDFLKVFIERGFVPLHGLIPDTMPGQNLTQAKVDEILKRFLDRHGGMNRAAIPMILQGIKDVKRLGLDMNELAYQQLRNVQEHAIIQSFGVPAVVAQTLYAIEHANSRANALADEGRFYRLTMQPFWSRMDDAFTTSLLPEFDLTGNLSLAFDTTDVAGLQEDRNEKAVWANVAVAQGGMSVHDWHRELGLQLPAGDDYYLRPAGVTVVPIADAAKPTPPPAAAPVVPPPDPNAKLSALWVKQAIDLFGGSHTESTTASIGPSERRSKSVNASKALIRKVAVAHEPKLAEFFKAEAKRIVPRIVDGYAALTGPSERYVIEAVDWHEEDRQLGKVLSDLYLTAGETAYAAIPEQFGITIGANFDLANPNVRDVMARLATRFVGIGDTTRGDIQEIVTQGIEDGLDADQIAANLDGLFANTYANRPMAIARTESMFSYGQASALGYKESGVVDRIQCFDNENHTDNYGAADGLSCSERNGLIDTLDSADLHLASEHPNGSLAIAPVLIGDA